MALPSILDRLGRSRERVLERLLTGPAAQKIEAEIEAGDLTERQAAAAEIDRLERELTAALPALDKAVADAEAVVTRAREALTAAHEKRAAASTEHRNAVVRTERAQRAQRAILHDLAPASIDLFVREMRDLGEALRQSGSPNGGSVPTPAPVFREEHDALVYEMAQRAAHLRRCHAVGRARIEADHVLRYSGLSEAELESRFAELRTGIAAAGVVTVDRLERTSGLDLFTALSPPKAPRPRSEPMPKMVVLGEEPDADQDAEQVMP